MYLSIISRDNICFDELSTEAPILASKNNVRSVDASGNTIEKKKSIPIDNGVSISNNLIIELPLNF